MSDKVAKHKQPWKPEELQKLQTLAGKGKGLKEIARIPVGQVPKRIGTAVLAID